MEKLIQGFRRFQRDAFPPRQQLFARLAEGQHPETLFITCSDSRIDPNLLTQTEPGELFVVRNAGNLVPRHGQASGAEESAVEYAIKALKVKQIVVCGHSACGAMKALLKPSDTDQLPAVRGWLTHAAETRRRADAQHEHLDGDAKVLATIQTNVLVQLENLRSLPVVVEAEAKGLKLYGWVYDFAAGDVQAYDEVSRQFRSIGAGAASTGA